MLASPLTFKPTLGKFYYFYKENQPLFKEMQDKIEDKEFLPCLEFEMIKNLEKYLPVFDDSGEEIYQDKEFVKLAVSGRHKKVNCIFVKHNLFHQSKWSRTIDLNTTHIILSNHHGIFSKLMFLVDSRTIPSSFEIAIKRPQMNHLVISWLTLTHEQLTLCVIVPISWARSQLTFTFHRH